LKNPSQKRAGKVPHGVDLEFKLQYCTHTKRTPILQRWKNELGDLSKAWPESVTTDIRIEV
jgi:hypothetical protein